MARNGFKVMDSDMHVIEPSDLWQNYIDPEFRDRAPQGFDRYLGDMQVLVEGHLHPADTGDMGKEIIEEKDFQRVYADPYSNGWDSASQVRAMDAEGIDVAFLYPSRGLFALALDTMDTGLADAIARAYTRWMSDFCAPAPQRMWGAAMISPFDVESAVEEVRQSVDSLGFRAAFMRPNVVNGRNWHDPYYDPLWRELEERDVTMGFHEGATTAMNQIGNRFPNYAMYHVCSHPMEMMISVVDTIGGGVMERFPNLRIGFLEGNCSWLPWLLWRMDEHDELMGMNQGAGLTMTPTEYFKRQGFVSFEADEITGRYLSEFGLGDVAVFSTDYPHSDSKYPHATEAFLEMPLSEDMKKAVLWDNCARLYNLN